MSNTPPNKTETGETLPQMEARVAARWARDNVFAQSLAARAGAQPWVFYEGPPTANGHPGLHHALARTFKDVFARHRTMTGHLVERKGGWDCHGLPVELETQRQLGLQSKADVRAYGVANFNGACRASAERYSGEFDELTRRLGFWLDTKHAYKTMDDDYVESVWWSLRQVHDRGLLYRSARVVAHCPDCGTTLSSHELEQGYKDVDALSAYVAFAFEDGTDALLAWTTTPWTLPANLLLAVDAKAQYARVRYRERAYVLAAARVHEVLGADADVLETFPGSQLLGRRYVAPFTALAHAPAPAFTVVAGAFVDANTGTGVVHVAPAHGEDDFALATSLNVPALSCVNLDGLYSCGEFAGQPALSADAAVTSRLRTQGALVKTQKLNHRYPHCWRCQNPLMYAAKPAWYAQTTAVKERMRELAKSAKWYPQSKRFDDWLANNVDWALSRERFWGTPLPLWLCERGHVHCVGSRAELTQLSGNEVTDTHLPAVDAHTFVCTHEGCDLVMTRTPEVLDVWWDSGAMPFAQHHAPFENKEVFAAQFPAAFVCEGLDQTRGWFYSLLAVSTLCFDAAPYENVMCLGLVADAEGQKMAKARGNAVDPWMLFDEYGADACRWYYLSAKEPWEGYNFSVGSVRDAASSLKTLLHAARFYRTYADASADTALTATAAANALDLWLLSRLDEVTQTSGVALHNYDATTAARALDRFLDDLSNWYVRCSRRRFWDGDAAALATLKQVLQTLARLLAPLTPFLAEECWELSGGDGSVHLSDYPTASGAWRDERAEAAMTLARDLARLGHSVRAHNKLPLRQPLAEATVVLVDANERAAVNALRELLARELNVKNVVVTAVDVDVCDVQVRVDFARLGPRLGGSVQELATTLATLDGAAVVKQLQSEGVFTVQLENQTVVLAREDVRVRTQPRPGYGLAAENGRALALNLEREGALEREGLAREVVHAVQNRRRECGFAVSDRVRVHLRGDEPLLAAAREHRQLLMNETLAVEFAVGEVNGVDVAVGVSGHCNGYAWHLDVQPAI